MKYVRTYTPKPCIRCGEMISAPKGPQRYCDTCRKICGKEGCPNPVRSGGVCITHLSVKHEVPTYEPINGKCGVEGCGRDLKQKGLCTLHYGRAYHKGNVGDVQARRAVQPVGTPCLVEGCVEPTRSRGYCATHYARWRNRGDVGGAELELRKVGERWTTESGYVKIKLEIGEDYEHRLVLAEKIGRSLRPGENAHHIDGNRQNNDPNNIELWVTQQPAGQRLKDRIIAAIKLLREYPDETVSQGVRLLNLESQEANDWYVSQQDKLSASILAALGQGV